MPKIAFRAVPLVFALVGVLIPLSSAAQAPAERRPVQAAPGQTTPNRDQVSRDRNFDAQETRRDFLDLLRKHPPAVARVLKLDPSLMRNESYLSAYPLIAEFISSHPEIPQNTSFYLEQVYGVDGNWQPAEPAAGSDPGYARRSRRPDRLCHRSEHVDLADQDDDRTAAMESTLEDPGGGALEADGSVLLE